MRTKKAPGQAFGTGNARPNASPSPQQHDCHCVTIPTGGLHPRSRWHETGEADSLANRRHPTVVCSEILSDLRRTRGLQKRKDVLDEDRPP